MSIGLNKEVLDRLKQERVSLAREVDESIERLEALSNLITLYSNNTDAVSKDNTFALEVKEGPTPFVRSLFQSRTLGEKRIAQGARPKLNQI